MWGEALFLIKLTASLLLWDLRRSQNTRQALHTLGNIREVTLWNRTAVCVYSPWVISALRHFIYRWWQSCSLLQAEPEGRRPVCDGKDGISQDNTLPLLSRSTVLRRKFFGLVCKYQRQNQWCWEEFRGGREVNGLGWINNKLESLIKTWSDMPASFPCCCLFLTWIKLGEVGELTNLFSKWVCISTQSPRMGIYCASP